MENILINVLIYILNEINVFQAKTKFNI